MTHLLSLSIGPVQPFIEAARRTADLTAGSELLVDIAKAVARSIAAAPNSTLIFPADPSENGPNKILARIEGDPSAIAGDARKAGQAVLDKAWKDTVEAVGSQYINMGLAGPQIETVLEFYAAWTPLDGNYADARKQVELLLAGRKALRDFAQPPSGSGVPKSPLDPARDSVILESMPRTKGPLFLKKAEHLDAVSLIKRVLGRQTGHVKSTTQLSAAALMKDLDKKAPAETDALRAFAKTLPSGVREEDLLYAGRRADARAAGEITEREEEAGTARAATALRKAGHGIAPPDWASYYAILRADGDRMGRLLGTMTTPDEHITFSRKLSGFAKKARTIVTGHGGHCVYSGGDDVVAILPTHTALDCAAKLAAEFTTVVGGTLSVGVAIVHHMEPLRISLERARDAEHEAKKERDSLAVALHTRGGEPRIVAEKWLANHNLTIWTDWIAAFRDTEGLSHGFPFELRHLAREAQGVLKPETLTAEADRILKRKQGGAGDKPYLSSLTTAIEQCETADSLEDVVAKLVICRFLAQYPEVK